MSVRLFPNILLGFSIAALLTGCDALMGSKDDSTTDEIFDAGYAPPTQLSDAEYVPLFPFFTQGANNAPLQAPKDIYVGFDEFIYIVDEQGLHVLNLAGQPARFIPIEGGATSVIQDRVFRVYLTARRDTVLNGRTWNLPVVYRIDGISTGNPVIDQTLWYPFDDDSRGRNAIPRDSDEQVEFTGVAVLADNSIYVSRRGPENPTSGFPTPHNVITKYSPEGEFRANILALSPVRPSLLSSVFPNDVLTHVHPPQRSAFDGREDFIVAQSPPPGRQLTFPVLSIRAVLGPNGLEYLTDTEKVSVASNPSRGSGFLYEEFKFENPTDLAYAADETRYLFVVDAGKDSLFVFTPVGVEGVNPPAGAQTTLPVVVSFGGTGDGARQFNDPQGVAYFNETVYVADTGNNRISRFRLNTDFE